MMFVALGLVGFGVADLVRQWSKPKAGMGRVGGAAAVGAAAVSALAALGGTAAYGVVASGLIALAVLLVWERQDAGGDESKGSDKVEGAEEKPESAWALVVPAVTIVILVAFSGTTGDVRGDLARWYGELGFPFVSGVPVGQALMALGAGLFLLATGNRIVRLTLAAVGSPPSRGEGKLRGGRLIGPMERLLVAGALVSGGLAGAGFVIAAKGLLRFRELGPYGDGPPDAGDSVDEITEYFLVGTFASILLACASALFVLASA